jgi:uncharacterized membrane protein
MQALEDIVMKRFFGFVLLFAAVSIPALAAKNSQTVNVPIAVNAGSTKLAPGDYNVTWTGSGSNVQVTFAQGKKVVVTLPATLAEQKNRNAGLETHTQSGSEVLDTIRMDNITLKFQSTPASGQ